MAREATFCFQPEAFIQPKAEKRKVEHYASISGKNHTIRFAPAYIRHKGLDGKFVKLHFDKSKKAIGWKIMEEHDLQGMAGYRRLKLNTSVTKEGYESLSCTLAIKSILEELGIKESAKFNRLEIKHYQENGHLGSKYDYVILKNE